MAGDWTSVTEVAPLITGRQLGEFVVGERLGGGGFADVYHAHQPSLGRDAVVKILRTGAGATPEKVEEFEREARLASQLDHPYAAHVYAFGAEPDGLLWIAMELVRGIALRELVRSQGPIALGRFVPLFEKLCEVVHTAHQEGLIHRDIKPANVMVITRAGRLLPKLLDFGIARARDEGAPMAATPSSSPSTSTSRLETETRGERPDNRHLGTTGENEDVTRTDVYGKALGDSGQTSGTPAFMAPEQWTPAEPSDHRVDIYALGILAYQCLTDRLPFQAKTWPDWYRLHLEAAVPSLGPEFPPELDSVLHKALAKNPDDRYHTALELAEALKQAAGDSGGPQWITQDDAGPWLLTAPPQLSACISYLGAAQSAADARLATERLVTALAQWLGILAITARASLGRHTGPLSSMTKMRREPLSPRDWIHLTRDICQPYLEHEELFPIPELVLWCAEDGEQMGAEGMLALLALTRPDAKEPGHGTHRELLRRLLRSLRFVHGYPVVIGGSPASHGRGARGESSDEVWLGDGDGNLLFELSPLVTSAPPAPGEAPELFALIGPGRTGGKLLALPDGFERESNLVWPWLEMHFVAGKAEHTDTRTDRTPYRGLASFSSADAELFHGRDRQVETLYNRVLLQPFVALTGPSGSGKSSLIHAGLIPRLSADWHTVVLKPGRYPMTALDAALRQLPVPDMEFWQRIPVIAEWAKAEQQRVLVVIDQAEEILTVAEDAQQRAYFTEALARLAALPGDAVRVVVALRHDFIGRADELPAWRELIGYNLLLLTVPSRDELAEMITAPAAQVGYAFDDPRLIDDMVDEVADRPGALPLLSFAASRLWAARDSMASLLTRESYQAMGGVGGALAQYAEETLCALPPKQQALVRSLFRQLITAHGTKVSAHRQELVSIDPDAAVVLEHLTAARILVASEGDDGHEHVSIIHEALVDRWPRLVQWRAEEAAGAHYRDELRAAASLWDQRQKAPSYLWQGQALATYQRWSEHWAGGLTATESAFVDASLRAAGRARRQRRMVVGASLAALSLAVVVLVYLNHAAANSKARAEDRLTDLLADRGRSELLNGSPLRAVVYLNAAYHRGRNEPGLRVALASALRSIEREKSRVQAHRTETTLARSGPDRFVSFARDEGPKLWKLDGHALGDGIALELPAPHYANYLVNVSPSGTLVAATGHDDRRLHIWNDEGKLVASSTEQGFDMQLALAFSPKDDLIACTWANAVALWDTKARLLGHLGTPDPHNPSRVVAIVFNADGSLLANAFRDGSVQVWNPQTRELQREIRVEGIPSALAIVDDLILVGTVTGEVMAWSLSTGELAYRFKAQASALAMSFDPSNATFSTTGQDSRVRIWQTKDGKEVAALDHPGPVQWAAYSPDGAILVTGGADSIVHLWDAKHYWLLGRLDAGADVNFVTFAADSQILITAGADGQLKTWDTRENELVSGSTPHGGAVWSATFTPDGKQVASFGNDRKIRLWNTDDATPVGALDTRVGNASLTRLVFGPEGKRLLGPFMRDGALWDVATGLRLASFDLDESYARSFDFGPNERVAVAAGDAPQGRGGKAVVFDLASGRAIVERKFELPVQEVRFDPTGTKLAVATERSVHLWDLDSQELLWSAEGSYIIDLDYSEDGRFVTAPDNNGFVRIWSAQTGMTYRKLKQPASGTLAVALSPDAALLAVACADRMLYIWDVDTGQIVARLAGHDNLVLDLDFSSDGTRLVSAGFDGRALVWSLPRERRSPEQVDAVIADKVPLRLDGVELVATESGDPKPRPPAR